jgi:hypothetical protein
MGFAVDGEMRNNHETLFPHSGANGSESPCFAGRLDARLKAQPSPRPKIVPAHLTKFPQNVPFSSSSSADPVCARTVFGKRFAFCRAAPEK